MGFWGFWVISIIEMTTLLLAMFALFRYSITYLVRPVLFFSTLLSVVSYLLFIVYESPFAPWIQISITILFLWLVLEVPLIYSALMPILYTAIYSVVQGILFWVAGTFFVDIEVLQDASSWQVYVLQLITSIFNLLIMYTCSKKNIGFTFVPTDRIGRLEWSINNLKLAIGMVIAAVVMITSFYFYHTYSNKMLWLVIFISVNVAVILLWFSYRREHHDD
ncbi:hypothetical protein DUZ99_15715 [Xylanibacillus composti]|uniref:Uncharacterized protein n=1 Tax=Xylanibacillus composti TaxID=1572762 RepID=A0A8J4M1I3_9BACL|nr:hypothetical protein [Xylanibacillus composti]GIQ67882.1 hypothetical protein XYCOK13_07060 [Xylanibacillus composti]